MSIKKISLIILLIYALLILASCDTKPDQTPANPPVSSSTSENTEADTEITAETGTDTSVNTDVSTDTNTEVQTPDTTKTPDKTEAPKDTQAPTQTPPYTEKPINKYTVTWKSFDGTVLETDTEVTEGTLPTYNGKTPEKPSGVNVTYKFTGWSPSVEKVTKDAVYTAVFREVALGEEDPLGAEPVLSSDGRSVIYGIYPQTHVSDAAIIQKLSTLKPSGMNGWYLLDGEYYHKATANVYSKDKYTFGDGAAIVNGNEYWFKCEPIKWNILESSDGSYLLMAESILDAGCFYADFALRNIAGVTVYANNYEHSDIRSWLNGSFLNTAFAWSSGNIKLTTVDNSPSSTNSSSNKYSCNNTNDKVFLPSYQDLLNSKYGFDNDAGDKSLTRTAKTTDYARARGVWCNTKTSDVGSDYLYTGSYLTRSASSEYSYSNLCVNSGGYLSSYTVDGTDRGVRPCISINGVK